MNIAHKTSFSLPVWNGRDTRHLGIRPAFTFHTMSYLLIKRVLFIGLIIISGIFIAFLLSGVPGFYDPYKLDGKGIDPHLYRCDHFRHEPSQCDGSVYWKQAISVAAIKTAFIISWPIMRVVYAISN